MSFLNKEGDSQANQDGVRFTPDVFLENHKQDLQLYPGLRVFSFPSGDNLLPLKSDLSPKFEKLWASALSRQIDDKLVIDDSAVFPYLPTDKVIILQNDKQEIPVFFSYREIETPKNGLGLYLHICLIDQAYQGKGLAKKVLAHVINLTNAKYIALTTQNEHMVQTLRPFCQKGNLYPIDAAPDEDMGEIASILISNKAGFNVDTFIRKSVYANGSPLYGDRVERHSNHEDIRNYFIKNVDFQKGDALLVIGKITNPLVNNTV